MKPTKENYKELAWEAWEHQRQGADLAKTIFRTEALDIANYAGVPVSDIVIERCPPVGEDCVYVKGEWSGYLDGWERQGHIEKGEGNKPSVVNEKDHAKKRENVIRKTPQEMIDFANKMKKLASETTTLELNRLKGKGIIKKGEVDGKTN